MVLCGLGQLGDGTVTSSSSPLEVAGLIGAVDVSAGRSHTCAVLADETAFCWGLNQDGQLGDGTRTAYFIPRKVFGMTSAVSISAGYSHTCAVLSAGHAVCWGRNSDGQVRI